MSGWFSDDEEQAIRDLPDIQMEFVTQVNWDEDVGDGIQNFFSRLSPAIDNGKIFAADRNGTVVAFSPDDGDVIWEVDLGLPSNKSNLWNGYGLFAGSLPAKIAGGLTTAYDSVLLGTENGEVIALNQEDGSIKWRTQVPSEVLAAPAADSGVVVVNTVAGILMGLDAQTGEILWRNESDVPPLTLRGVSAPSAANGGAIVGLATGRLQVSIIDSGLTAWEQVIAKPTGATELERIVDVDSKPLVFGGTVFVISYGGSLSAVELRTGQVIWTRDYAAFRSVTIAGNRLFVTDNDSTLYAIDRRNGVELWSSNALRARNLTEATPVGDYIVTGDKFGFLHWFTQDEGKYVSRLEVGDDDLDEGIYAAPVYQDGLLVVQLRNGNVSLISTP
ncbi:outer membrane protein assembly factor BamB [Glaciecola sp. XM2]|jgi:outer membrane protein assembly factor BamB|nr:outer membrane protein assembly factor BamB [Glaciecola sp. XM2]